MTKLFLDDATTQKIIFVSPVEYSKEEHTEESANGDDRGIESTEKHSFNQSCIQNGNVVRGLFINQLGCLLLILLGRPKLQKPTLDYFDHPGYVDNRHNDPDTHISDKNEGLIVNETTLTTIVFDNKLSDQELEQSSVDKLSNCQFSR